MQDFVVYTKSGCLYCDLVKHLLDEYFYEYTEVSCDSVLSTPETKALFLEKMEAIIGRPYTTFPMVFCNGTFVGGYRETKVYIA